MIPAKYRPVHQPDCACIVCWTNAFHAEMTARNEQRHQRCHQILSNPLASMPEQTNLFALFDEVSQ